MAYTGLPFLLLMSSSLLISTFSQHVPRIRQAKDSANKVGEGGKAAGRFVLNHIDEIRLTVPPFLGLIPVFGPLVSGVVNMALMVASMVNNDDKPTLETILSELNTIKSQMEKYHLEQTWNIWAAVYHKPEIHINLAWDGYVTLRRNLRRAKENDTKIRHEKEFLDEHQKYKNAVNTLHRLVTDTQSAFGPNLRELLPQHVHCHDREIREYTALISLLIWKGNTVNLLYNRLKKIKNNEDFRAAMIAYDVAKVMFQIQKDCITKSQDYVRMDIETFINKSKTRDDMAHEVRTFLEQTFDRYDWMVVAYTTKNSNHKKSPYLNEHTMTDFYASAQGQETSIEVARQVKGTHDMSKRVEDAISKCLKGKPSCHKVGETLRKCKIVVDKDITVSDAITAVHAYSGKSHQTVSTQLDQTTYIYIGDCMSGKFTVLIKSDEELMNKDPCAGLDCGGSDRGHCIKLEGFHMGICECKEKFYGRHCESRIGNYMNEIVAIDSRSKSRVTQP